MKNRKFFFKAQIFIFDLILSVVILMITIGIIFGYFVQVKTNQDLHSINLEIISGFTQTGVNSLNNEEVRIMFKENQIKNIENTVAQQVAFFHWEGEDELATNLIRVFVSTYVGKHMNFNISLNNGSGIYREVYSVLNKPTVSFDDAEITSTVKRSVFVFINSTHHYGNYNFKIEIWS